ncbi:hypothetical protein BgiMline_035728 [Biomphalaria glabrata]|nr:hypothetical protein BgiMline_031028 [Biomphalaria glabrata]
MSIDTVLVIHWSSTGHALVMKTRVQKHRNGDALKNVNISISSKRRPDGKAHQKDMGKASCRIPFCANRGTGWQAHTTEIGHPQSLRRKCSRVSGLPKKLRALLDVDDLVVALFLFCLNVMAASVSDGPKVSE